MKNVKNVISRIVASVSLVGVIAFMSLDVINTPVSASATPNRQVKTVDYNTTSINTVSNTNKVNLVKHDLANVTNYENGMITVEYNGQYHQFTSNSKYIDYANEQYTELAQYNSCTYIVINNNGNIDEDTEAFDKDAKTVVDARTSYINNNKDNPNAFKVTYTDGSYYIDNQYLGKYVCYNASNGDVQSWKGSEDMHEYMKSHWNNNKVPVTGVPCK
jgi:hypothetical protein